MNFSFKTSLLPLLALLPMAATASNYPPGYSNQNVRLLVDGPAVFAHVGSGCGSAAIIGYKSQGVLAETSPKKIDAVVHTECFVNGEHHEKTSSIVLGKEWHGNGYVSEAHSEYAYFPESCGFSQEGLSKMKVNVAFSADGHWDSKFGANYGYEGMGFWSNPAAVDIPTNSYGCGGANLPAWEIIVNALGN